MCPDAYLQKFRILGIKNLQASREKKLVTFFRNVLGMSHTRGQRTLNSTLVVLREDDFFKKYLFIWLHWALVAACKLLVEACGIWFPGQGLNLGPLHWES